MEYRGTIEMEKRAFAGSRRLATALLALALVAWPAVGAEVTIDTFADDMALQEAPPTQEVFVNEGAAANMVGTERDLRVERIAFPVGGELLGGPPVSAFVNGGTLNVNIPKITRGEISLFWDGADADIALDPEGLGGVDLTDGGLNSGLRLSFGMVFGDFEIIAEVYTDADNASRGGAVVSTGGDLILSFSAFEDIGSSGGADFSSVGAVVVRILATNASGTLTAVTAVPPILVAEKDDLDPDTDTGIGATPVAPGSTIRYRVTITNSGAEAADVDLSDMIDPSTTLSGAVRSTPVAGPDGYSTILDTALSISDPGLGLLANDSDPDPEAGTLTVSASDTQSIQSAVPNVTVDTDGTFDYTPPAGFLGVDAFGYTLSDGDAVPQTIDGQVTILVINAAPVLAPAAFLATFTEDAGPVVVASTITVSDANDTQLDSATATITNLTDAGEEVLAAATGGTSIVASYIAPVLTLTGPDTLANFQTVLQSITYENTSDDPSELPLRQVQIVANDGTGPSNTATSTVTVNAVNDGPMITAGAVLGYTEADPASVIDSALTVTDPDSATLTGGTVAITGGFDAAEDVLAVTNMLGITGVYDGGLGVLTLSGIASPADYQAVLRTVTYRNTDLVDPSNAVRTVTFTLTDGSDPGSDTATVNVADDNEPPSAGADAYTTVGHVEIAAGGAMPTSLARVEVAAGVLDNDSDGEEGSPLTVVGLNGTLGAPPLTGDSAMAPVNDGNVTLNADGSFSYLPPLNLRGVNDTFTYTVSDGTDTTTATVTITIVDELVWFVHNDAAGEILNPAGGDGRSSDPLDELSDADAMMDDAEAVSAVDEHIFVFEGDGTTANQNLGITLKTDQILLGHAAATTTIGGVVIQTPNPPASTGVPATDQPVIGHGAGNGVTVNNVTGVEIRDLEVAATGGHGIHVTSSGANNIGATIRNSTAAAAGTFSGLRVEQDSTGIATLTVEDSFFAADGDAAGLAASDGTLEVFYNRNNHESLGGGGAGLAFEGSEGGGPGLFVRELADNTVGSGNTGVGLFAEGVIFDSDSGTVGNQTVLGGISAIGAAGGNEVQGDGMVLTDVRGALDFDQLDIFNNGGIGLALNNPLLAAGDFSLTIDAGTVATTAGLALDMDPATVATTFTNVTASGNGAGVRLVDLAGTVSIQSGSITSNDATTAFHVGGGTAGITYAGTIDNIAGRSVVVENRPAGAGNVTFSGVIGNLASNSGTGVLVTGNAAGTVGFTGGLNLATGTNDAVTLTSNGGATVQLTGGFDLDTTSGTAFNVSGGGTVTATSGTNTVDATTGSAILVNGTTVNATFTGVGVTAGSTVAVSLVDSPGTKIFNDLDLTADLGGGTFGPRDPGGEKSLAGSTVFFASNGGVIGLPGAGNTFDATGGTGICWINTDLAAGVNGFSSLQVDNTGESNPALIFDGVGGGSLQTPITVSDVANPDFAANGVEIRNSTSTFVFDNTSSIVGVSGNAFQVGTNAVGSGGANPITYLGTITNNQGNSVRVQRRSGGAVTFGGLIDDTGSGIFLESFTGGTTTFRGGLDLDTFDDIAFRAVSAGTVNVCATIDCAGGTGVNNELGGDSPIQTTAVSIDNTTIGANHVTFRTISVDQASPANDDTGIFLRTTGSTGDFRVTGDGSTSPLGVFGGNGSGGTLENFTDVDAVTVDNVGGRVHLQNMIIEDIGDSGDGGDAIGTRSARDGIHAQAFTGGLTLDSTTIRRVSDNAINGSIFADGISATAFNGLEIRNSLLENTNRFHVANRGDDGDESMVRIIGMTGTVRVDNSRFHLGAGAILLGTPTGNGTLDITVQRSRFEDLYKEFGSGATLNVGRRGLDFTANGSHDMVVRIGDPAESSPALGNTFLNNFTASIVVLGQEGGMNPHTGDIDVVISHNTFRVTDHSTPQQPPGNFQFNFPQGGVALAPGDGTLDGIVSNNLFDQVMRAAGGLGQLSLALNGGDSQVRVSGNTFQLPWDAPVQIRADGNNSAAVLFENNTFVDGMVGSATDDLGGPSQSPFNPFLVNVLAGGSLDLTVRNENLPQHDIVFTPADRRRSIEVEVQADNATNTIDLHLLNNTAPEGYSLKQFNGTLNLFRGASVSNVAATIVDDNGNTGGGSNPATDPPAVPTQGTITAVGTAPTLPVIVIP